jgi:hypothetical protein
MPLSPTQTKVLQSYQSSYGCGASECVSCYPLQYACEWCNEMFAQPIALGEVFICPMCDWTNNEDSHGAHSSVIKLLSDAGYPLLEKQTRIEA